MKRAIVTFLAMSLFGFFAKGAPLTVGAEAPPIVAVDQNGVSLKFADIYAKGITLVYFYPKAGTPGCTAQACSLRDAYVDLLAKGIHVIGVSRDSVDAQKKFEEKHNLPFPLVADADGKVAAAFGVDLIPIVGLTQRESFLIKEGKIAWVSLKAQTAEHADEVRKAVAELK